MPSTPQAPMGAREWRMLLGLSVLWGGSFFFLEIALTGLAPLTLVFLRVALAALAYVSYFRLLAAAGATNLLLVTLLIPVNAILLGVLFLDETLTVAHLAGMLLIAMGLAAIDGRLWRRAAR